MDQLTRCTSSISIETTQHVNQRGDLSSPSSWIQQKRRNCYTSRTTFNAYVRIEDYQYSSLHKAYAACVHLPLWEQYVKMFRIICLQHSSNSTKNSVILAAVLNKTSTMSGLTSVGTIWYLSPSTVCSVPVLKTCKELVIKLHRRFQRKLELIFLFFEVLITSKCLLLYVKLDCTVYLFTVYIRMSSVPLLHLYCFEKNINWTWVRWYLYLLDTWEVKPSGPIRWIGTSLSETLHMQSSFFSSQYCSIETWIWLS